MKLAGLFFFLALLISRPMFGQKLEPTVKEFDILNRLAGTWEMKKGTASFLEIWTKKSDSLFIGKSLKVLLKDSLVLENVKLFLTKDAIVYAPTAIGQNNEEEIHFNLIKRINKKFTFENKKHDFPQRIIYDLISDDILHAWIEGEVNGKFEKSEFKYVRVKIHNN